MPYTRAASEGDLWDGEMLACRILDTRVVLVRLGGTVAAYEDRCAHLGVELSRGKLEGHVLTCSAHLWQYDARTGRGINPDSVCLKSFPTKTEGGIVYVDVGER